MAAASAAAVDGPLEMRGQVQTLLSDKTVSWDAQSFPGFYHDIDQNVGNEEISLSIGEENRVSEPDGIVYATTKQSKNFKFEDWGSYDAIGFMGKPHLAGYSGGDNLIEKRQIFEILMDDDEERVFSSAKPLALAEGYQLEIKALNESDGQVFLELTKDGKVMSSKILPAGRDGAGIDEKTFVYKRRTGDLQSLPLIQVYIKNAFRGLDQDLATAAAVFQISENPTSIELDHKYGMMRVASTSPDTITMDNKDHSISIAKKTDLALMGDIHLKSADQDLVDLENPLRFYISREVTEPGTYEIRGPTVVLSDSSVYNHNPQNFAGFFYDVDENLGTEQLTVETVSDQIDEPMGLRYNTVSQEAPFAFRDWGYYQVLGFLGNRYFAGYSSRESDWGEPSHLYSRSEDPALLTAQQLTKILLDYRSQRVLKKGESLKLEEGYELLLQGVNEDGQAMLELLKDGQSMDTQIIAPSVEGATIADKTYLYTGNLGDSSIITIAVHFKNAYRDEAQAAATIDGVWQISDQPLSVAPDTHFDKMRVASVSPDAIAMDNKDMPITMSKNKDVIVMGDLHLRTADQGIIDEVNPLRYYLYREEIVEPASY
jgi:S-layer protein (TIGR01567 family)